MNQGVGVQMERCQLSQQGWQAPRCVCFCTSLFVYLPFVCSVLLSFISCCTGRLWKKMAHLLQPLCLHYLSLLLFNLFIKSVSGSPLHLSSSLPLSVPLFDLLPCVEMGKKPVNQSLNVLPIGVKLIFNTAFNFLLTLFFVHWQLKLQNITNSWG